LLKIILTAVALTVFTTLGVFGPGWLMSDGGGQVGEPAIACDVLEDNCLWRIDGKHWEAQLSKVGHEAGNTEYRLSVATEENHPRMLAVLRGESMYLGEYPVPMTRSGGADADGKYLWDTRFTAPFCSTDPEMTWSIDLQTSIDVKIEKPVKMIFRAEGRI